MQESDVRIWATSREYLSCRGVLSRKIAAFVQARGNTGCQKKSGRSKKKKRKVVEKWSVNGIAIFPLEAQDAAWLASYQSNIRARFTTS